MRILQISHRHHIAGGSDAVFFATCDLLRSAGHQVIPFCMSDPANQPTHWSEHFPEGADTSAPVWSDALRYFYNRDAREKLDRLLAGAGPVDVAHLHIYHGKQTPAILPVLRRHGIPVVQTLHEYKLACPVYTLERNGQPCELCVTGSALNALRHRCKDGSVLRSLVMLSEMATSRLLGDIRLVDRFICVSDFQRHIMKRAGVPARKLLTLHNFLDLSGARPAPDHGGYYLYFGRIEALKGISTLIDAFADGTRRLVVAGTGSLAAEVENRAAQSRHIDYRGFLSGRPLAELIAKAKAVIVPSQWYENCPMSILEAKAHGRPVIAAEIGGIPELVQSGQDGFLFEPGNVASLVSALDRFEGSDHAAMAAAARTDAEQRFSAAGHLEKLLELYTSLSPSPQQTWVEAPLVSQAG